MRKYGLGSLRKTPTEGILPTGPGPTSGQLALILQPNISISHKQTFGFKPATNRQLPVFYIYREDTYFNCSGDL